MIAAAVYYPLEGISCSFSYPLVLTAQYSLSLGVVTEVPCLGAKLSTFTYAQAPSEVIGFTTVRKIEEKLLQLRSRVIIVRC